MSDDNRRKHPSGRPIHNIKRRERSIERPTYIDPLTARLRTSPREFEMGFHSAFRDIPELEDLD